MKILIVSDTHGIDENLEKVLQIEADRDMLFHLGDVEGSEDYIEYSAGCPVEMVAGNCDQSSDLPGERIFDLCGKKVMLTHGSAYRVSMGDEELLTVAAWKKADIVCYGHTHRPVLKKETGTAGGAERELIVINPGSLTYPRQMGRQYSYAILRISENTGKTDCEIKYLD